MMILRVKRLITGLSDQGTVKLYSRDIRGQTRFEPTESSVACGLNGTGISDETHGGLPTTCFAKERETGSSAS